jgi:hypothetical protein
MARHQKIKSAFSQNSRKTVTVAFTGRDFQLAGADLSLPLIPE